MNKKLLFGLLISYSLLNYSCKEVEILKNDSSDFSNKSSLQIPTLIQKEKFDEMSSRKKLAQYNRIYQGFSSSFKLFNEESKLKFQKIEGSFYDDEEGKAKKAEHERYKQDCEKLAQVIQYELNEMLQFLVWVKDESIENFEQDWKDANGQIKELRDKIIIYKLIVDWL